MNLRTRLARLEVAVTAQCPCRPTNVLFLDLAGHILWDGTKAMHEWAGKHVSVWPPEWLAQPWAITTVVNIDPLVVLGDRPPSVEERSL